MDKIDEIELVKKAQKDAEAFMNLYEAYIDRLYAFVRYRVKDRNDSEDIVSEIWEKILKGLSTFTPTHKNSFSAWIFRISHHSLIDYYRKKEKEKQLIFEAEGSFTEAFEKEDSQDLSPSQLKKLINVLPPKQAEIVGLRFFGEMRNKEIASCLKISEKTVASNLCRALRTLQEEYKGMQ